MGHEQCIDFSKSTNLTTIVLWVEISDLGHRYHGSPWLTFDGTVVNLPSSIQEITVYLCSTSDGYHSESLALTEQLNWDGMQEKLRRFPDLRKFHFVIQHLKDHLQDTLDVSTVDRCLKHIVEKQLSILHERGVLFVSSSIVIRFGPQINPSVE